MIWVIGAKGMLGAELCDQLVEGEIVHCESDLEVSILEIEALREFAARHKDIRAIVNCSAYTAVDRAEDDQETAFAINAKGPANIARVASELGVRLVHISTDYVFPGDMDRPLREDDSTGPISVYGASKLEGEQLVRDNCKKAVIIRTAWLYGLHGNNFVFTMLRLMSSKSELSVVNDQVGSPTNAKDLAAAVRTVLDSELFVPGNYHYTGKGRTTWYGFAKKIQELGHKYGIIHRPCEIRPVSTDDYPTRAMRPRFSLLDCSKINRDYGVPTRSWETAIEGMVTELGRTVSMIRTHRECSDEAIRSAGKLVEAALPGYVHFLCAESVRYLLLPLYRIRRRPTGNATFAALISTAPIAFDTASRRVIERLIGVDPLEMVKTGNAGAREAVCLFEDTQRLRECILQRTVLAL